MGTKPGRGRRRRSGSDTLGGAQFRKSTVFFKLLLFFFDLFGLFLTNDDYVSLQGAVDGTNICERKLSLISEHSWNKRMFCVLCRKDQTLLWDYRSEGRERVFYRPDFKVVTSGYCDHAAIPVWEMRHRHTLSVDFKICRDWTWIWKRPSHLIIIIFCGNTTKNSINEGQNVFI